jgi:UDP-N-acetylmuramoyl-L-alanyl-D-glutamate--2,6-diaminopimelate ligase
MQTSLSLLKSKFHHMTADSRLVKTGSVFVAYKGEATDGREFIPQAIENGAGAVIWEQADFTWRDEWQLPNQAIVDLKQQIGQIASEFYGQPSQHLWMIGVTGTNGKTTCTHWLAQAFSALNKKAAVVGTLGNGILSDGLSETKNTTPDSILLHQMLADYLGQKAAVVAMEVSSHGLDQGRVNGVAFDIAVFTNLTRDHLDYHGDMQAYAAAKKKLFAWHGLKIAVLNRDDTFGFELTQELKAQGKRVLTYGLEKAIADDTDISVKSLELTEQGMHLEVQTPFGDAVISAGVVGRFNAYNLLAVLATLLASDVSLDDAVKALSTLKPVAGRMQQYGGGGLPLVVIDYAHTPDALEQVLKSLRAQTKGQLVCVFGCGGDRDSGKRPLMGKVASELADKVIVTSDNPRSELPAEIIKAVMNGVKQNAISIESRADAIARAIENAQAGDVILLAGKGHENYQEIAGVKYPFSDIEMAQQFLQERAA